MWVRVPLPPFCTRAVLPSKLRPSAVEETPEGISWVETVTPVSLTAGVCTPDRSTTYCTASCPSHFTVMWVLGAVEEALRKNTAYLPWPMEESSVMAALWVASALASVPKWYWKVPCS